MIMHFSSKTIQRFKSLKKLVLFCTLLLVAGCAYAEVRPVKTIDEEGIRFYRPWPYVWITLAKEGGGCEVSIQWLPDMRKEYIIIPHPGIGSLTVSPTLTEGWNLTAMNITADSKASEMVTAISGMIGNIASAVIKPATPNKKGEFGPGLYRLVFGEKQFTGLDEVFYLVDGNGDRVLCSQTPQEPTLHR